MSTGSLGRSGGIEDEASLTARASPTGLLPRWSGCEAGSSTMKSRAPLAASYGPRWWTSSPIPTNVVGSSLASVTSSASRNPSPPIVRTCSQPGGCCSSACPTGIPRFSSSRICNGLTPGCWISSSTYWTGRVTTRCSSLRLPVQSSPTSAPTGARAGAALPLSTWSLLHRTPWRSF